MVRQTYFAPGVYVEVIPSARQPIAGVGTNTVGFIGLIPDVVYIPEVNPDYDPVLAQHMLRYRQLVDSSKKADEERQQLDDALSKLNEDVKGQQEKVEKARQALSKAEEDEKNKAARVEGASEAEDKAKATQERNAAQIARLAAQKALDNATEKLKTITDQRDDLKKRLDAPPAPPPGPVGGASPAPGSALAGTESRRKTWLETEDLDYESKDPAQAPADDPDKDLLVRSRVRPYYLKPFTVQVGPAATKLCTNFTEYTDRFGWFSAFRARPENPEDDPSAWTFRPLSPGHHYLTQAVDGFFRNGGTRCFVARIASLKQLRDALKQFESIDEVALLAAPGLPKKGEVWEDLETYCEDDARPNVFAILDPPAVVNDGESNALEIKRLQYDDVDPLLPRRSTHAAYYFPYIEVLDPAKLIQDADPERAVAPKYRGRTYVPPSGHVAGIYARTDEERGVHKAPANATVRGALEVKYYISKPKQESLNPQGVNCIRLLNGEVTVWGARTMGGDRNLEFKYINVRRLIGFLAESIEKGTQWVVFEPNDPNLWSRIILNVTAFLTNVWRSGALFGLTPAEAFYVKCDAELNPPEVRDLGQVVTEIGVAIVRPAEFVIFRITQSTGVRPS